MKVGGMCWVISTGTRSITAPISVTSDISACGPPVEEPISSTRGATRPNGRSELCPAAGAATWRTGSCRTTLGAATGAAGGVGDTGAIDGDDTERRSRAARWRILNSRSRLKVPAASISRVVYGFGT